MQWFILLLSLSILNEYIKIPYFLNNNDINIVLNLFVCLNYIKNWFDEFINAVSILLNIITSQHRIISNFTPLNGKGVLSNIKR